MIIGRQVGIMHKPIQDRFKISPFLPLYVIMAMQIGIGVLGFQRVVAKDAGNDAWISVLGAGLIIHVIVWVMYKICETVQGDVLTANVYVFGKIAGKALNSFFIFYYILTCAGVLSGLIEIIKVWMFPELNTFVFASVYLLLAVYIINGGLRTVAGMAFFSLVLPAYLLLVFGLAVKHADFTNLLPVFDHTLIDMIKSGYRMSLTYLGYDVLLFIYPFIKEPQKSKKWAHLGVFITTVLYTVLAILTFAYFSGGLLEKSIWPTLEMWKIVQLPFIERFEYIGIANWAIIIIPNVAISLWVASRVTKQVFHLKQRKGVIVAALLCLGIMMFLNSRERINMVLDLTASLSFAVSYLFIPFLYLSVLIAKKVKKK